MSTEIGVRDWEGAPVEHWRETWHIPELQVFRRTGSTNEVVKAAALRGSPAGSTAIADHQSAGRGRLGRAWVAAEGRALLLSVLFRPAPGGLAEAAGALPLRVGLAVADALRQLTVIEASIKWPNDVIANGGKLAGILCEAASSCVVVGIGVNVLQQREDFPPELRDTATSVRLATGSTCSRARLAGAILDGLRPWFNHPHAPLDWSELQRFASLDALAGSRVSIDQVVAGTATGIDSLGALIVAGPGGPRAFHAGTVRRAS